MPSAETCLQLEALTIEPNKPLIICDVDEVVVHFIKGLEAFLDQKALWLDTASFALNGNIKHKGDNQPLETHQVKALLAAFFATCTASLDVISGAVQQLTLLSESSQIVFLSNLPHSAVHARRENLDFHNLRFPLISNEGAKGPAIAHMTREHNAAVFFIDDIPNYLESAFEHCPETKLIHFTQDQRFARHLKPLAHRHFRTDNWADIGDFIKGHL